MTDIRSTVSEQAIKTIVARLEVVSADLVFSSGADGNAYTRDEMIKQVEEGSPVGVDFVNTELDYLRAQASGTLSALLAS